MATRKKQKQRGPYRHRELGPAQAVELRQISAVLDEHPELERMVALDLERGQPLQVKRRIAPEQVLRAFVLTEMNRWGYEELEYPLADSQTYRAFCRTDSIYPDYYRKETLEAHLEQISSMTIDALHKALSRH